MNRPYIFFFDIPFFRSDIQIKVGSLYAFIPKSYFIDGSPPHHHCISNKTLPDGKTEFLKSVIRKPFPVSVHQPVHQP